MFKYNAFRNILPLNKYSIPIRNFTKNVSAEIELSESEDTVVEFNEDDHLQRELEIEKMRNKSRLLPQHRNMLLNQIPYNEPKMWSHETVKYNQKMYGRYGESSGVNPGICWPTIKDLKTRNAYESLRFPHTIPEMMKMNEDVKAVNKAKILNREAEISKKLEKLDQWKTELQAKMAKKLAEAEAAKERKERLVEEVRRHFGFKVDPKDERFKEMLEQKEKEDKKKQKESKRKIREAKMIAKFTEKSESTTIKE